jgi:hypothetical protein
MKAPAIAPEETFLVLFRRPGLQSRRKPPGTHGLQPLKKCLSLSSRSPFSHAAALDEGLP